VTCRPPNLKIIKKRDVEDNATRTQPQDSKN